MGINDENRETIHKGITMKTKLLLPLLSLTLGALPLLAELKYFPKDKAELLKLVKNEKIKLDEIDTSKITDMSYLFCLARDNSRSYPFEEDCGRVFRKDFKGIEKWDTSNVENMSRMFDSVENFNVSIGSWNVSKVKNMKLMLSGAKSFNQPLEKWDVSNVEDMCAMFDQATSFNQPLNSWNVSNVRDMSSMFSGAKSFNQSLNSWDVSSVKDMSAMFSGAKSFDQPLNKWDVSNVENMTEIFYGAKSFNQDLSMWKTIKLKEYGSFWGEMFEGSPLEKDKKKQFKF